MFSRPRGVCPIINNMDPDEYRYVSDTDEGVQGQKRRADEDHLEDIQYILSHGTTDRVYGTGGIVSRDDIYSPTDGASYLSLNNKSVLHPGVWRGTVSSKSPV